MDGIVAAAVLVVVLVVCIGMLPVRIRADWWEKIRRGRDKHDGH